MNGRIPNGLLEILSLCGLNQVNSTRNCFIPKNKVPVREYPNYYTYELISLIVRKANAKASYMKEKDVNKKAAPKEKYSDLRKLVKKGIKSCFNEEKIKTNTKCFFSFTKSLRKTKSLPNSMKFEDEISSDRVSICNLFSKFFTSVFNPADPQEYVLFDDGPVYDPFVHQNTQVSDMTITPGEIERALKGFNVNKVASPDNIPMLFFMNLSMSLSLPLCILFNKSLKENTFPSRWKTSFVSPIFKDGDKNDLTNYRAVSIMCAISKIFERLVFNKLFDFDKDKVDDSQHGFFAGRSTQTK